MQVVSDGDFAMAGKGFFVVVRVEVGWEGAGGEGVGGEVAEGALGAAERDGEIEAEGGHDELS